MAVSKWGASGRSRSAVALVLLASLVASPGCSIRRFAVDRLGDALARGGSTYASDADLELVRDAIPFGLKTIEGLLAESPRHRGLLLAAASGFTQFSYAFVDREADYVAEQDLERASAMRARAVRLYERAAAYGWRGLEVDLPGLHEALRGESASALAAARAPQVPLLYWTAAAIGAAVSLDKTNATLATELPLAARLMERARELEPDFELGAIHDFFLAYDGGRPPAAGGSLERAQQHFERAVTASKGLRAAPYVAYAETVSVARQDRAGFEQMLARALAVDPEAVPAQRLANTLAQKRARWLLARLDQFFLE